MNRCKVFIEEVESESDANGGKNADETKSFCHNLIVAPFVKHCQFGGRDIDCSVRM